MKKEVAQAEADPEVSLSELTKNIYVDNDKRSPVVIQITFAESCTRSQ